MKREKEDLSILSVATASTNKTAISGMLVMNLVLALAYAIEVVKHARGIGSYLIILALCVLPSVLAIGVFVRKKDALTVRYIFAVGFALLYAYIMLTTTMNLVFCYVIVAYVILMVYTDTKLLLGLGSSAILVNIVVIVKKLMAGTFVGLEVTQAEIVLACLMLTGFFTILALNKIRGINQANIERAEKQQQQSEGMLQNTLEVAAAMTENIKASVEEAEGLKEAIGETQRAMEILTDSAKDGVSAIAVQKQNTETISANKPV